MEFKKRHDNKQAFHPETRKGVPSDSINDSTEVDTVSRDGDKELKATKVKKSLGSLTEQTKDLAEHEVRSEIKRHAYGNVYEFDNGEEWLILKNEKQAHDEAVQYLENVWDEMGIIGWNKSFIESFIDEDSLKRKTGVTFDQIYGGKYGDEPNYTLAKRIPINKKELFNESIKADGVAHSLASYNGKEVELSNGSLMYRVN